MTRAITTWRCAAFALPELAATLVIVGVAVAMLLVGAGRARLEHNSAAQSAQLRWIAGITTSYAADFQDRMWALSWREGETPSTFPDLSFAISNRQAVSHQAVDIMRRRGGELDIPPMTGWIPSVYYSHLPLADYLDVALPMFDFIAPADEHRLNWARDREGFSLGAFLPFQPDPVPVHKRWPYSSSYEVSAAMVTTPTSGPDALQQAGSHAGYTTPAALVFEGARHSDVTFPSQKALVFDREQRIGERQFFLQEHASVLVMTGDGAVAMRRTAESNPGWIPSAPTLDRPSQFLYEPAAWDPQSGARVKLFGHYRWTRGGPAGRDFGGPEIDTGQQ